MEFAQNYGTEILDKFMKLISGEFTKGNGYIFFPRSSHPEVLFEKRVLKNLVKLADMTLK